MISQPLACKRKCNAGGSSPVMCENGSAQARRPGNWNWTCSAGDLGCPLYKAWTGPAWQRGSVESSKEGPRKERGTAASTASANILVAAALRLAVRSKWANCCCVHWWQLSCAHWISARYLNKFRSACMLLYPKSLKWPCYEIGRDICVCAKYIILAVFTDLNGWFWNFEKFKKRKE